MSAVHDQGVCIRHWDFSETSQTVSLFGRSLGIVRGLAKGARRERGAFDGGIDLLSRGEFGAIVRRGKELATLTEWDLLELYPRLRTDLSANRAAFYMADVIGRMLEPEDPHPALYDRFVESLRVLGAARASDEPPPDGAGALLSFQWTLLTETGFRPSLGPTVGDVAEFSPVAGGTVAAGEPVDGPRWKVRVSTVEFMRSLESGPPPAGDPGSCERANRLLAAYVRHLLGAEPPTMHALFGAQRS
jgi:DNA repair protein RecO (recombination protein O)